MNWRMLWDNFVVYAMQIGLLIGLAAFVPALIRLRMPQARLAYWHLLLIACLLLPALTPRKHELIIVSTPAATPAPTPAPSPATPKRAIPRSELALALVAAGIVARLAWLGAGFWRLRRYRLNSRPLEPASYAVDVASDALFKASELRPISVVPYTKEADFEVASHASMI